MSGATDTLRAALVAGDVYADALDFETRAALHVGDPLVSVVADALAAGRSVVLAGNAGDGKSHLAQMALGRLSSRAVVLWSADHRPEATADGAVTFLRDASEVDADNVLLAIDHARRANGPVLATVNAGPLGHAAEQDPDGPLAYARRLINIRADGLDADDPDDLLVLDLSARQLARIGYIEETCARLCRLVEPCGRCNDPQRCVRVLSAQMLMSHTRAPQRIRALCDLLSAAGFHLSARALLASLVDVILRPHCERDDEPTRAAAFFFNRLFDGRHPLATALASHADPASLPTPSIDEALWRGMPDELDLAAWPPLSPPSRWARVSDADAIRAARSARRGWFFLNTSDEPEMALASTLPAARFAALINDAAAGRESALRAVIASINHWRMASLDDSRLLIARHHALAAHKRPSTLAWSHSVPIDHLDLRVAHGAWIARYPTAGFVGQRLLLAHDRSLLPIDLARWRTLSRRRPVEPDVSADALDLALDGYFATLAQDGEPADGHIEAFNHRTRTRTTLAIGTGRLTVA